MSRSVCNFMPAKKFGSNIKAVNFVYETGFHKLNQPFLFHTYYVCVVTKGNATISVGTGRYKLHPGSMYFAFPSVPFSVEADNDYEYIYISFIGDGAMALLNHFNLSTDNCIFHNNHDVVDLWTESIKRINKDNSNILTECCLFYALSFL